MSATIDKDILVVGSGPAGATVARIAAQRGLSVLLVDKKQELGAPVQCSGAVSAHALQDVGISPDAEFVFTPIHGFAVYNTQGQKTVIDYRQLRGAAYGSEALGYVVDRRRFDRHLMTAAQRSGAQTSLKTEALGYRRLDGDAIAVRLSRFGEESEIVTRVVVGADGIQSQVGKWFGLRTHIRLSELASCLQYVVDGVQTEGLLEIITGHQWAPGGYAWVFPKNAGYTEVGLGVIRTLTNEDARFHLDRFISDSFMADRFSKMRILEIQGGGVPLAAPLKQQYADNMILVGDAARHVNPITGGGIHTAMRCGEIAATFLADLLTAGRTPTAANLAGYQERWMRAFGEAMWKLYRVKREIFRKDVAQRDTQLFETLANYFSPESEYRKI